MVQLRVVCFTNTCLVEVKHLFIVSIPVHSVFLTHRAAGVWRAFPIYPPVGGLIVDGHGANESGFSFASEPCVTILVYFRNVTLKTSIFWPSVSVREYRSRGLVVGSLMRIFESCASVMSEGLWH